MNLHTESPHIWIFAADFQRWEHGSGSSKESRAINGKCERHCSLLLHLLLLSILQLYSLPSSPSPSSTKGLFHFFTWHHIVSLGCDGYHGSISTSISTQGAVSHANTAIFPSLDIGTWHTHGTWGLMETFQENLPLLRGKESRCILSLSTFAAFSFTVRITIKCIQEEEMLPIKL